MKKAITNKNGIVDYIELTAEEEAIINNIADTIANWKYLTRPIRVFLTDSDYVNLLIDYPQFATLRQELNIPVEQYADGEYLYFEELHEEDRQLLEYFGGITENMTL